MFYHFTNILLNTIISRYFTNSNCLYFITDSNDFTELSYINHTIPIVKSSKILPDLTQFGCQGIIFQSENLIEKLINFEYFLLKNSGRFNNRRYLLIPAENSKENSTEIFELNEVNYLIDLLIIKPIVYGKQIIYELKTHKFIGKSFNNQEIILDRWFSWNRSFEKNSDLYPDKLENVEGRILKLSTINYRPFSVIGDTLKTSYGSEMMTALAYSEKHNFTPEIVLNENENDYWGFIYANWSGTGILGNVVLDKADMAFAAIYIWPYCYEYLDFSKPLVRSGITCIVPAPKLATNWLTPLYSFSTYLWYLLIFTYFILILVLSFSLYFYNSNQLMFKKYKKKISKKFWNILEITTINIGKIFINQPLTHLEIPKEQFSRLIVFLLLVLSIFFSSSYSSGLASIMTIPKYTDAIDTVEDLAKSNLKWGATEEAWITSIENSDDPKFMKIVDNFVAASPKKLEEYSKTSNFGFSLERLPYNNFAIGDYIKKDILENYHLMKGDLYSEHCIFVTRKNSVLLPSIDLFLLRVFEAGLVSYWQNQAVALSMDFQVQNIIKYYVHNTEKRDVIKLKLMHVKGAFAILVIGCGLSFLIFLTEIISKKIGSNMIEYIN